MRTIHTIFTDKEFNQILKVKDKISDGKSISWHDFILIVSLNNKNGKN